MWMDRVGSPGLSPNLLVVPNFPGGNTFGPHFLQHHFVAQAVHGVPEAGVWEREKIAFPGEVLHPLLFPGDQVAADLVNHFGFEHEEPAADPGTIASYIDQ